MLKKAVDSARDIVDEVCILDTGSQDGAAVRQARSLADKFHHMRLDGREGRPAFDFGLARRSSLAMASHDAVLVLDSDEYLTERSLPHWLALKETFFTDTDGGPYDGAIVSVENELPGDIVHPITQVRLFRRSCAEVTGTVHHRLTVTGKMRLHSSAAIRHTGYNLYDDELRRKYTPRLPLMKRAMEEAEPEREAERMFQYAVMLYQTGRYRDALDTFQWLLWQPRDYGHAVAYAMMLRCLLCLRADMPVPPGVVRQLCTAACAVNTDDALTHYHAGLLHEHLKDIEAAVLAMRQAHALAIKGEGIYRVPEEPILKDLQRLEEEAFYTPEILAV